MSQCGMDIMIRKQRRCIQSVTVWHNVGVFKVSQCGIDIMICKQRRCIQIVTVWHRYNDS